MVGLLLSSHNNYEDGFKQVFPSYTVFRSKDIFRGFISAEQEEWS